MYSRQCQANLTYSTVLIYSIIAQNVHLSLKQPKYHTVHGETNERLHLNSEHLVQYSFALICLKFLMNVTLKASF